MTKSENWMKAWPVPFFLQQTGCHRSGECQQLPWCRPKALAWSRAEPHTALASGLPLLMSLLISSRRRHKELAEGTAQLLELWELAASASFPLLRAAELPAFDKIKQLAGGEKQALSQRRERVEAEALGLGLIGSAGA